MNARVMGSLARPLWTLLATSLLATVASPVAAASWDPAAIGKAADVEAKRQPDGRVKIAWSRTDVPVTVDGMRLPPAAGLGSWAAFSGSGALAPMDGDFIMTAAEVQPMLRALRQAGVSVVALHNHMMDDTQAFYFTHFWGKGPAATLARGVRAALDAQSAAAAH